MATDPFVQQPNAASTLFEEYARDDNALMDSTATGGAMDYVKAFLIGGMADRAKRKVRVLTDNEEMLTNQYGNFIYNKSNHTWTRLYNEPLPPQNKRLKVLGYEREQLMKADGTAYVPPRYINQLVTKEEKDLVKDMDIQLGLTGGGSLPISVPSIEMSRADLLKLRPDLESVIGTMRAPSLYDQPSQITHQRSAPKQIAPRRRQLQIEPRRGRRIRKRKRRRS